MAIDFLCGQCQHTLRVPDESAGKKARCPQCGNVQEIPAPHSAPGSGDPSAGQFDPSPPQESPMAGSPGTPDSGYGSTTPYKPSGQSAPNNPYTSPSQRPNPYQAPTQAGYYGPQPKTREQVKGRVVPPAIALMVVSGLSGLMAMGMIFVGIMAVADNGNADEGDAFAFAFFIAILLTQFVVFIGAARMMVLKNYGFAMTAAILSIFSGTCCWLLLPFGIWAVVILVDSDTRGHFS